MPLTRTPHWATREYNAHLKAHAHAPFAWGTNDCCTSAANAIESFTGVDIAADFRGKYTDMASALTAIKAITGGSTIEDAAAWCASKHGLVEYPMPLYAQRGDLVLMAVANEDDSPLIAGVVHLNGLHLVSVGEHGLVRLSIRTVRRAWKV
jgi:hypothetical protein